MVPCRQLTMSHPTSRKSESELAGARFNSCHCLANLVRKWTANGARAAVPAPGHQIRSELGAATTQKCRIQGHKTCVMTGNQSMKLISNWFWPHSPGQSLQEVDQRKCETINSNDRGERTSRLNDRTTGYERKRRHRRRRQRLSHEISFRNWRSSSWFTLRTGVYTVGFLGALGALNDQAFNDTRSTIDLPNTTRTCSTPKASLFPQDYLVPLFLLGAGGEGHSRRDCQYRKIGQAWDIVHPARGVLWVLSIAKKMEKHAPAVTRYEKFKFFLFFFY